MYRSSFPNEKYINPCHRGPWKHSKGVVANLARTSLNWAIVLIWFTIIQSLWNGFNSICKDFHRRFLHLVQLTLGMSKCSVKVSNLLLNSCSKNEKERTRLYSGYFVKLLLNCNEAVLHIETIAFIMSCSLCALAMMNTDSHCTRLLCPSSLALKSHWLKWKVPVYKMTPTW